MNNKEHKSLKELWQEALTSIKNSKLSTSAQREARDEIVYEMITSYTYHRFRKLRGGSMLYIRNHPKNANLIKSKLQDDHYVLENANAHIRTRGTTPDVW